MTELARSTTSGAHFRCEVSPRRQNVRYSRRRQKILAISSGGGHWVELLRLRHAFAGHFVVYSTVDKRYGAKVDAPLQVIPDVTRWDRAKIPGAALKIARVVKRVSPDVVVSTGALPGFLAMMTARTLGIRSIWVDSLANVDEPSMSGRLVRPWASLWLTQWEHLAKRDEEFAGSVLTSGAVAKEAASVNSPRVFQTNKTKIFVTVGAQMPFDRLIKVADRWAGRNPEFEVVAQLGVGSEASPKHMRHETLMGPDRFEAACDEADILVGHAGTGTIFSAMDRNKKLVMMTRQAARRETRNDHQIATAKHFQTFANLEVCWDEKDFDTIMSCAISAPLKCDEPKRQTRALHEQIASFIDRG